MAVIEMREIMKRFPGVVANDQVDFALHKGKIHGLLGENGAGKTTLMNVLFGLYQADEGEIYVRGEKVEINSPADAIDLGIGMVHQHYKLVPPLTVAENIILGLGDSPFLDLSQAEKEIAQLAGQYGLDVDPTARVQGLTVSQQQRVEILSSLYRGAEVLILDEPTAVLTPQERESLGAVLREMAEDGKAIVFISHKLEEVLEVTDEVTVLRGGKVVFSSPTGDTDKSQLSQEMIGKEIDELRGEQREHILAIAGAEDAKFSRRGEESDEGSFLLQVKDLHVRDDRDLPAVRGMSFNLRAGEILGIAGVDGNGQHELVEAIVRQRNIESGELIIDGERANDWTVRDFINHGEAYITDDRHGEGLVLDFDLGRNTVLKTFRSQPYANLGLLNFRSIREHARQLIADYDIRTPGPSVTAGTLSGGNQQKLILAREISRKPSLIVANKATRGLDIGAAAYIHKKLFQERERGTGILLNSTDIDEVLLLSDRVLVMYNGQSMGVLDVEDADSQTLGLMMAGTPLVEINDEKEERI
ncbi:MAG: ABC transporter ATP-binding protein [Anaerolineales bacterium]